MAIKIKQILDAQGTDTLLFSSWLTAQGINRAEQAAYVQSGWLEKVAHGVYKVAGANVSLFSAVSAYNSQLGKQCIIGAETALDIRGYSHYVPMGKPLAFLFTESRAKLPQWFLTTEWDRTIRYHTISLWTDNNLGLEQREEDGRTLLISSPERAIMECLNRPFIAQTLMDTYYIMEMLTTLRPKLVQQLLEQCSSVKVKRLFLYLAEKANYPWYKAIDTGRVDLGSGRRMISPTGKYVSKYNITIPTEVYNYV
jgi:predicted transcriptional regulator of viral defense system